MRAVILAWLMLTSPAVAAKPWLLPVVSKSCGPCRLFDRDCVNKLPGFLYHRLKQRFRLKSSVDVSTTIGRELVERFGIRTVPCFLVVTDDMREIGRVENSYHGPQWLDQQLTLVLANAAQKQQADPRDDRTGEIEAANKRLQERLQEALDATDLMKRDGTRDQKRIRDLEQYWDELREQIDGLKNGPAESDEFVFGEEIPAEPPTIPHSSEPTTGDKWAGFIGGAAKLGLALAAPEIAIPAGTALSALAIGMNWWRKRRAKRGPGRPVVVDGPAQPGSHTIETQFVNVESDNYQRAHETARQHIARRYPGSQEVLEAELSLTRQFLAGQAN